MAPRNIPIDPQAARQFAVDVVRRLRAEGYDALWAGGCVRDWLLGSEPKDYDVATSARPEQIRDLFGQRRTLALGAAFGVITVLGPREAGQIEVATFRRDAGYSDGRHPDSVSFSSAEEDAQRRDFTINGLFFDPIEERVIDYVGGQDDLKRRIVRAIRDPRERFQEDKLRMLRAVRFTATFEFALDHATADAIREQAHEIVIVSAERIAAELKRMLEHAQRARAVGLLHDTRLLPLILPEAQHIDPESDAPPNQMRGDAWHRTLDALRGLSAPNFGTALAVLLREIAKVESNVAHTLGERLRLSNDEIELAAWLLRHDALARQAHRSPWPQVQRMLVEPGARSLVAYLRAVGPLVDGNTEAADFCAGKLALPAAELNPPPLATGVDLKKLGLQPGPQFKTILDALRDAQLEGKITTSDEALALARELA